MVKFSNTQRLFDCRLFNDSNDTISKTEINRKVEIDYDMFSTISRTETNRKVEVDCYKLC